MGERTPTLPVLGLLDGREQSDAKRSKVVLNRRQPSVARETPRPLTLPWWARAPSSAIRVSVVGARREV